MLVGPSLAAQEFWPSLAFSFWVSLAATVLAAAGALGIAVLLTQRGQPTSRSLLLLHLNLAIPHLVWAIALALLLSQSGLLARLAAAIGLIQGPAAFPVLVRDRYGIGIILHYVTKEIPFLTLLVLAVLRSHTSDYNLVASNLGASGWQSMRYVTLPMVFPALAVGSLMVFALVFGAYEVPAVLGVPFPRMLASLALSFFQDSNLLRRSEAMAVSAIMAGLVIVVAIVGHTLHERR